MSWLFFFLVHFLNSPMIKWKFNFSPFGNISCIMPEATGYDFNGEKAMLHSTRVIKLDSSGQGSEIIILKNKIQNLRCFSPEG